MKETQNYPIPFSGVGFSATALSQNIARQISSMIKTREDHC